MGYLPLLDSPAYILRMTPNCLRLFWQLARFAASRARASAGNRMAARMPMMAITTSNSMSVNPCLCLMVFLLFCPLINNQCTHYGPMDHDATQKRVPRFVAV